MQEVGENKSNERPVNVKTVDKVTVPKTKISKKQPQSPTKFKKTVFIISAASPTCNCGYYTSNKLAMAPCHFSFYLFEEWSPIIFSDLDKRPRSMNRAPTPSKRQFCSHGCSGVKKGLGIYTLQSDHLSWTENGRLHSFTCPGMGSWWCYKSMVSIHDAIKWVGRQVMCQNQSLLKHLIFMSGFKKEIIQSFKNVCVFFAAIDSI